MQLNDLPRPRFMEKTPRELGIGSWGEICTVSKDTPLIQALNIFLEKRVSALPIVDENGRVSGQAEVTPPRPVPLQVVDIYAKFDVINLAADKTYNDLDVTVIDALKHRSDVSAVPAAPATPLQWFEGVRSCACTDSMSQVIDSLVKAEVHRLIVTDASKKVVGIISLSDILKHLIIELPKLAEASVDELVTEQLLHNEAIAEAAEHEAAADA